MTNKTPSRWLSVLIPGCWVNTNFDFANRTNTAHLDTKTRESTCTFHCEFMYFLAATLIPRPSCYTVCLIVFFPRFFVFFALYRISSSSVTVSRMFSMVSQSSTPYCSAFHSWIILAKTRCPFFQARYIVLR
jgi:hypothetical protein